MDPITQGVFGSLFAQLNGNKAMLVKAGVIGAISGMVPDLDIFIRSSDDPLLALEFHRHFTHSLLFIPLGALLCCLVIYPVLGQRWGFSPKQTFVFCALGYATHGLLDGCTSYGTQLLWPLSTQRFSWDIISVVDPLVTLPLLALTYLAGKKKSRKYVYAAILWMTLYFGFGYVQHERVIKMGESLAQQRGHAVLRIEAKPSFGNLIVWKSIYETKEAYHVDGIRPGFLTSHIWEGANILKLDFKRDLPWLDLHSQQAKDIERFRWFSGGYIALDPDNPLRVVDIRYSLLPNQISPLWGVELARTASSKEHVLFESEHKRSKQALNQLLKMIFFNGSVETD